MSGLPQVTVIGTLTAAPELRFTPSGAAVASFTIAANERKLDKATGEWVNGSATFVRCSLWRQAAENLIESVDRGDRVIAIGRLKQRDFETREGDKRTVLELEVDEIGPSVKFATAKANKSSRGDGGNRQPAYSGAPEADPWGASQNQPSQSDDEPPF